MTGGGWPGGYGLVVLDSVDSTNSEARRRAARGGEGVPLWIASSHQSSGRGRSGRRWLTERGNLAATLLLLAPPGGMARTATLSFAAGLAVADMLQAEYGLSPALKWPNDVLVDRRKIAGILIEAMSSFVAVGIGVNLDHSPSAEPGAWESVSVRDAAGRAPEFDRALVSLARNWDTRFREWERDFSRVRDAWLARAAFLGETISARLPGETLEGRFEGIDMDGALLLCTAQGRRRFGSAEVFGS